MTSEARHVLKTGGFTLGVALLGCALARPAAAQWPQPEGGGQVILQMGPYWADTDGYDSRGNRLPGRGSVTRLDISPYWEHGLTQRWTVGLAPRLQATWMDQGAGRSSGFGMADTSAFARYTIHRGDWNVLAVQGTVVTPGVGGRHNTYIAEPHPSFEARVLYGHSFELPRGMTAFTSLAAGYRFRPGSAADEVRGDVTLGFRPVPDWMVMAQYFGTIGMRNNGPGGPDYAIHRAQFSIVHDINARHSIQLGYMREVAGRRVALGQAVLAAWWYRY